MEKWLGRVALVTGGSKGIGAAIAKQLVQHGMIVFACARDITIIKQAAEELAEEPGRLHAIKCNLQKEGSILAMYSEIKKVAAGKGVDVLINNCGIVPPATILTGETDTFRQMLDVNVLAPSICAKEAIKSMKQRRVDDGYIININSSSGKRISSTAKLHFYSATKFALTALTEGLRQELRQIKSHIRVSGIYPGITDTPALDVVYEKEEKEARFAQLDGLVMQPDDVANAVVYMLSTPPHVQVQDLMLRPLFH